MKRNFKFFICKMDGNDNHLLEEKEGYYENIEGVDVGICEVDPFFEDEYKEYAATELSTGYSLKAYGKTIKETIEAVRAKLQKHQAVWPEVLEKAKSDLIKRGGKFPVNPIILKPDGS